MALSVGPWQIIAILLQIIAKLCGLRTTRFLDPHYCALKDHERVIPENPCFKSIRHMSNMSKNWGITKSHIWYCGGTHSAKHTAPVPIVHPYLYLI